MVVPGIVPLGNGLPPTAGTHAAQKGCVAYTYRPPLCARKAKPRPLGEAGFQRRPWPSRRSQVARHPEFNPDGRCGQELAGDYLKRGYFNAVCTLVKVEFRDDPRLETTVMMATEMPAAISPYSIAVAPESSLTNREISLLIVVMVL